MFLIVMLAYGLDYIYTVSFKESNYRSKVGYAYNEKPKAYDVVILGSSRADNHLVTKMFTDKKMVAFNFGMQGAKLFESDLVLKLLLEKKNTIKNVIIDVDVTLRTDKKSEAIYLKFLPYLHRSDSVKRHLECLSDFNLLYNVPFYKYMKYDTKIGFREVVMNFLNKRGNELDNGGYHGLPNNSEISGENLKTEPIRNKYYEEIKEICKKRNINLIAVMTPMCENVKGMDYFDKVKKIYPEIYNYENVVVEDKYFSSCGHMNDEGARIFTQRIITDFFSK